MAAQLIPDPTAGGPFAEDHPKAKSWSKLLAQQQRWLELHLSFGKELAQVRGPSDYWDWLLKHAEIIPEAIDRDRLTSRPITVASRPPVTYNPDWVSDQLDRSTDVEFIKRLHSRMLDESIANFVIREGDRALAFELVEFWARHLSGVFGTGSQLLEDHASGWRAERLEIIAELLKRRWPVTTWASNNASPEFWRKIRADFEALGEGDYGLIWTTVRPRALTGELLESHFSWCQSPDEGSCARFSAIAKRAAIALGYESDDGWYEELRKADFVKFILTGAGHQKDENGLMVPVRSGPIKDVLKHSITLTFLLEADSEAKGSVSASARPEQGDSLTSAKGSVDAQSSQSSPVEGPKAKGRGSIFSLDGWVGVPTVVPEREFPERRHTLPDASESLKQEFRLLAQESIIFATRNSSYPVKGVDNWLDRLRSEGFQVDNCTMEQLLTSSRDHLRKMRVYELGLGQDERADLFGTLAGRFEQLRERSLNPAQAGLPTSAERVATRAKARRSIVMPLLEKKGWTRGRLVIESGVGKGTVYEYLDGSREWISFDNGQALAETLELSVDDLPDVRAKE